MKNKVIDTGAAKLWIDENGIFHTVVNPGGNITLEKAIEHFKVHAELTTGKTPVLLDIRNIKEITREVRRYLAGKESEEFHSALALLVESPLSKVVGNLILGLNKSSYPIKIFTSLEKAVEWLKQFVEKKGA